MRAIRQERFGGPEVLALADVPVPEPLPTEVLVRVHAAGVNPVDAKTRAGDGVADVLGDPPLTVGWDVSGVVAAVGEGVTRFSVGDAVMGMPRFPHEGGGYAEYAAAPSRQFVAKPSSLDHVHAAAVPLAGLTAWQALVGCARVQAGQRVLVNAAAGGVGHLAVQLAKARGAYVLGTARAAKHELLRELGCDEPIDYTEVSLPDAIDAIDVALDAVGGGATAGALACVRRGGVLVTIAGAAPGLDADAAARGIRLVRMLVEPDRADLEAVADLVRERRIRPVVERVLPLAGAAEAHELLARGRTRGKLVLSVA